MRFDRLPDNPGPNQHNPYRNRYGKISRPERGGVDPETGERHMDVDGDYDASPAGERYGEAEPQPAGVRASQGPSERGNRNFNLTPSPGAGG